jgi:glycosyltransferase involved in cell wall biosynthesis
MVTPTLGPGGAETQLAHLASGLARAGHRITVACTRQPRRDTCPLEAAGVRVVALHHDRRAARALSIVPLARLARRADVVYCGIWDASLWGRLAAVLARRPAVVTEHSGGRQFELAESGRGRGRLIALHNRLLGPATYAVIAVGGWQLPMLRSEGVAAERIIHVPNGVPVQELQAAADAGTVSRAELGLPPGAKVLLHPARFHPVKNQAFTLDAVHRLRTELGDVRVLFAGDGDHRSAVEAHAAELGADWATFLGNRSDVPALMRLADLVVLPSSSEGMPVALLEALVLGAAVVAADVGAVASILEAAGAPPAVAPGDLDAFVAACRAALESVTTTGADQAAAAFDAELMIRRYAAVFAGAVAGIPPGRLELATQGGP